MEESLVQTQQAVASLQGLLQGPAPTLRIAHRSEPPLESAAITEAVSLGDLGPWFEGALGELSSTLAAQGVATTGAPGSVIADAFFSDERGDLTIFIPTAEPVRRVGRVGPLALPAVELATIVHPGSDADVDRTYGSLATYVSENALAVDGPIRERYLVGRLDEADEANWRTEIGWPIFHTGPVATPPDR